MSAANTAYLAMVLVAFAAFALTLAFGCLYVATDPAKAKKKAD